MADEIRNKLAEFEKNPAPDADRLRADVAIIRERYPEIGERFGSVIELYLKLWSLFAVFTASKSRMKRFFSSFSERASRIFGKAEEDTEAPNTSAADITTEATTFAESTETAAELVGEIVEELKKPARQRNDEKRKERQRGAKRYPDAPLVIHEHPDLNCGQRCPACDRGNLIDFEAARKVRLLGEAMLRVEQHVFKRLRCSGCQELFSQRVPDEMKEHSDESARAIVAIMKYDGGVPFNRLQVLTGNFGVEVPKSTVFDMVEKAADAIAPVHEALVDAAADAEVLISDDTTARILDHEAEREDCERKGLFTTGIVAKTEGGPTIHLYATGPRHTGENMKELVAERDPDLPPPIQMSDAASRNFPEGLDTLAGKCLTHARRKFVDCHEAFPSECGFVIRKIGKVYGHERECQERGFDKFQRLAWHVEHSGPVMDELIAHAKKQLDDHLVEPNGELGKALQYLINHWPGLTLFLRVPGCPLDSNEVERALKVPIRNRKNALFFKTRHGAMIGDILMSVIRTARASGINPHDYLVEIQRHKTQAFHAPEAWLPWNYRDTLERIESERSAGVASAAK